jgi:hypothetical protein
MKRLIPALALTIASLLPTAAPAGERRFAFSYEADTVPAGTREFEQWVTWKGRKDSNHDYSQFTFREEFEFGLTDRLQLGIYLFDWTLTRGNASDDTEYKDTGFDLIYNLTDPTTDWLGSALYGEVLWGPELLKLEGKLLLQKNVGKWMYAWNTILEAEWEGDQYAEDNGAWENTFGISYQINPSLSVGVEALHEVEFEDWSESSDHYLWAGPNISYRKNNWFIVAAPMFQITDDAGEPDYFMRTIMGFHF